MKCKVWNAYSLNDDSFDRLWCFMIANQIRSQLWEVVQILLETKRSELRKDGDKDESIRADQTVNYLIPNEKTGNRLIHLATEYGAPSEIATLLIQLGAWRSLKNEQGETPAQIAARQGHDHLIDLLQPEFHHVFPVEQIEAIEKRFNLYVAEQLKARSLPIPCDPVQLSVLQEYPCAKVWYRLLPGYGSVSLELESDDQGNPYLTGRLVLPYKSNETTYLIYPGLLLEQDSYFYGKKSEFLQQQLDQERSLAFYPSSFIMHRWELDGAISDDIPMSPDLSQYYPSIESDPFDSEEEEDDFEELESELIEEDDDDDDSEDNYILLDDDDDEEDFEELDDEEITLESARQQLLESFQTMIEYLLEEGDRQTALKFSEAANQLFANNVALLQQKAKLLIQSEDYSQALKLLNQVADFGQALDSDFYEQRAEVYEALEQWAAAAQDYSSVVLINPDHPDLDGIYSNIGTALAQQKDYEGSLAAYSKAIAHNSEMGPWYLNRALTYAQMERWEEAIADCTRALVNCPPLDGDGYVDHIYSQRALAHVGRGNWAAAIADWQAILKTQPQDPEALLGIAIACSQQNQLARSRYHRQQALAVAPPFDRCRWLFQQCRTPWSPSLKELAKRLVRSKI